MTDRRLKLVQNRLGLRLLRSSKLLFAILHLQCVIQYLLESLFLIIYNLLSSKLLKVAEMHEIVKRLAQQDNV